MGFKVTLQDTSGNKFEYDLFPDNDYDKKSSNKKVIPALIFPTFHKNWYVADLMQKYISRISSGLFSESIISKLLLALHNNMPYSDNKKVILHFYESINNKTRDIKDIQNWIRSNIFCFYVKGGSALKLITNYYYYQHLNYIVDEKTLKPPFRFESDWDTNILINPLFKVHRSPIHPHRSAFSVIREILIAEVIEMLDKIANEKDENFIKIVQSYNDVKIKELIENEYRKLSEEEVEKRNVLAAYHTCSFLFPEPNININYSVGAAPGANIRNIDDINFERYLTKTTNGGTYKMVRFNPRVEIKMKDIGNGDSSFFLGRLMVPLLMQYKNNRFGYLPWELIDISIPTASDKKLEFNWKVHQNDLHINWNGYNYFVWSPITNYLDIARMVWEFDKGISKNVKTEKRRKRAELLKKELLLPHISDEFMQHDITQLKIANPVLQLKKNNTNISFIVKDELDNLEKQTISKNYRGRPFGSLKKLVDYTPQPQTAGFYSHEITENINENLENYNDTIVNYTVKNVSRKSNNLTRINENSEKYNDTNVNYTVKNVSRKSNNLTRKNTRNRVNGNNNSKLFWVGG